MIQGDAVKVFPADEPERGKTGVVLLLSDNHKSAVVEFDGEPSFVREAMAQGGNVGLNTSNGMVTILLDRDDETGPWTDIASGLLYEIRVWPTTEGISKGISKLL